MSSFCYICSGGKVFSEKKLWVLSKISIFRYATELISTCLHLAVHARRSDLVFIGVDPLNALCGILLKKIGRTKRIIFYSADYADKRFGNKILNYFYRLIDRICANYADSVWNVSSRILQRRKFLSDDRNLFVPNVPSDDYKKYLNNKRDKYQLITLGVIGDQLDFKGIINAFFDLKIKYPKLSLKIIGSGPKERYCQDYVKAKKLDDTIQFLGYLNHHRALDEISRSGIGLALYNGKWNFNYYGDSMKCREFFCYGLPVITTDTHSTVDEIKLSGAGVVCRMKKDDYKRAIVAILNDYNEYSKKSYGLAAKYQGIHSRLLSDLLMP
ncbi:MAG: glycosyltransferase [Patescibacteria group bacterium]